MGHVILVKHGDPVIIPEHAPPTWSLSQLGRRRSMHLANRLAPYNPGHIVSSDEDKAVQTAEVLSEGLGLPLLVDRGLRENDRSHVPYFKARSDFTGRVEEFFRRPGDLVLGRETADQAHARFLGALGRISPGEFDDSVVVVSHGAVVSLLVARANDLDVISFWSNFRFTSFAVVTPDSHELVELVHADWSEPLDSG